jgi:hypothetical protein
VYAVNIVSGIGFVMGKKSMLLDIPDDLYQRLQEAAEASDRSPEDIVLETVDLLLSQPSVSASVDSLLSGLSNYSDTQLWAVVHRHLPWVHSLRLRELNAKGKEGALTSAEENELDGLVTLVDRIMLLRSQALLLLKQRGQDVETYLKLGA